jgi:hypothetical protein
LMCSAEHPGHQKTCFSGAARSEARRPGPRSGSRARRSAVGCR